jgi:hypothetical protein
VFTYIEREIYIIDLLLTKLRIFKLILKIGGGAILKEIAMLKTFFRRT